VKRLRVLALVHEGLTPPPSLEGISEDDYKNAPWKCEYDVTVTLREMGHNVRTLPVYDDLRVLREAIEEFGPHIAFNLLEEWGTVSLYDQNVVAYLELKGVPYTGCNPRGLLVARDKAMSKKLLSYHRIRVPGFAVFPPGRRTRRPRRLQFPLIVKSMTEDASMSISQASLVRDDKALAERVSFVHESTGTTAIAEEFIDGRELYVGVLGNERLEAFPVWELLFTNKPEEKPLIATARAKWNAAYQKRWGVISRRVEDLPAEVTDRIRRTAKRIYRYLYQSGYSRIDFRLTPEGDLHFLEANPNPQIAFGEDFAEAAEKGGLPYECLLRRILNAGLGYRPVRL
jgi:D-alanine-D-alanine ligase